MKPFDKAQNRLNKADNRTDKRKLGDIGENIACDYLVNHGFEIIGRNYLRKWGELDIIAKKANIIRFIEVKSARLHPNYREGWQVSCVTLPVNVIHETGYRPEDNVHPQKLKRLSRVIQTYILEKRLDAFDWQLDIITVKIDQANRKARIEMLENIII